MPALSRVTALFRRNPFPRRTPPPSTSTAQENLGFSWTPKIPSFTNEAKDELLEPKCVHQDHVWKPESQLVEGLYVPPSDPRKLKKLLRKDQQDTASSNWFNMPAPTITPEAKKDLEILKLRSVVDRKRHYKKAGANSKMGTVIESSSDYYSSRFMKKERKASITEELLLDPNVNADRKRKVQEIEAAKCPSGCEKWKKRGSSGRKQAKSRKAIL